MFTRIFIALLLALIVTNGFAQKVKYSPSVEALALIGSNEAEAAVNTTHGIMIRDWSVSLGAGMDFYRFRSVPVFVDIKKYFSLKKIQPYIQASAGINVASPTDEQRITRNWLSSWWPQPADTASFKNGFYSRVSAGIIFNPKQKVRIGLFSGWSYKTITSTKYDIIYTGSSYSYEPRTSIYRMNRVQFGLSVFF